jgi:hypothetical protein
MEEFNKNMLEVNKVIQLYGYSKEIEDFNKVVECYNGYVREQSEKNKSRIYKQLDEFFSYSFNKYRSEIAIEKLPKS